MKIVSLALLVQCVYILGHSLGATIPIPSPIRSLGIEPNNSVFIHSSKHEGLSSDNTLAHDQKRLYHHESKMFRSHHHDLWCYQLLQAWADQFWYRIDEVRHERSEASCRLEPGQCTEPGWTCAWNADIRVCNVNEEHALEQGCGLYADLAYYAALNCRMGQWPNENYFSAEVIYDRSVQVKMQLKWC
ncbi:hypothetical protein MKZ38_006983 [Zalerion maritima]|uniref:Uncharacterized protein n=1 Tax=Zalerion maritima TaxID=339359 RepID=A0AAD5RN46_9PEZI|nr:hypothetical protein MKZ38_006983 [Zalerion maritima]